MATVVRPSPFDLTISCWADKATPETAFLRAGKLALMKVESVTTG